MKYTSRVKDSLPGLDVVPRGVKDLEGKLDYITFQELRKAKYNLGFLAIGADKAGWVHGKNFKYEEL